jgi:hypothetical protein
MLNRSKSVLTIALTLASAALIVSAGAQAQGKSAGKGKGAEQAQVAWSAPGHVKAKGNGHPNHKGNGYGHGPHEGHDDDPAIVIPEGCYAAAAVSNSIGWFVSGPLIAVTDEGDYILADYDLSPAESVTDVYLQGRGSFTVFSYIISAYDGSVGEGELLQSVSFEFPIEEQPGSTIPKLNLGEGDYAVEMLVTLCGDLSEANPA